MLLYYLFMSVRPPKVQAQITPHSSETRSAHTKKTAFSCWQCLRARPTNHDEIQYEQAKVLNFPNVCKQCRSNAGIMCV